MLYHGSHGLYGAHLEVQVRVMPTGRQMGWGGSGRGGLAPLLLHSASEVHLKDTRGKKVADSTSFPPFSLPVHPGGDSVLTGVFPWARAVLAPPRFPDRSPTPCSSLKTRAPKS